MESAVDDVATPSLAHQAAFNAAWTTSSPNKVFKDPQRSLQKQRAWERHPRLTATADGKPRTVWKRLEPREPDPSYAFQPALQEDPQQQIVTTPGKIIKKVCLEGLGADGAMRESLAKAWDRKRRELPHKVPQVGSANGSAPTSESTFAPHEQVPPEEMNKEIVPGSLDLPQPVPSLSSSEAPIRTIDDVSIDSGRPAEIDGIDDEMPMCSPSCGYSEPSTTMQEYNVEGKEDIVVCSLLHQEQKDLVSKIPTGEHHLVPAAKITEMELDETADFGAEAEHLEAAEVSGLLVTLSDAKQTGPANTVMLGSHITVEDENTLSFNAGQSQPDRRELLSVYPETPSKRLPDDEETMASAGLLHPIIETIAPAVAADYDGGSNEAPLPQNELATLGIAILDFAMKAESQFLNLQTQTTSQLAGMLDLSDTSSNVPDASQNATLPPQVVLTDSDARDSVRGANGAQAPKENAASEETSIVAVHLNDDTNLLMDFLNRAKASKAARIAKRSSISYRRDSNAVKSALASPRKVLKEIDTNSPTPRSTQSLLSDTEEDLLKAPPSPLRPTIEPNTESIILNEADDSAEPQPATRRSTRSAIPKSANKSNPNANALNVVSVRRPDGQERLMLKRSEAQEVATVTRANTRRNKGGAVSARQMLLKLKTTGTADAAGSEQGTLRAVDEAEPNLEEADRTGTVRWKRDEELLHYFDEGKPDNTAQQLDDTAAAFVEDRPEAPIPPAARSKSRRAKPIATCMSTSGSFVDNAQEMERLALPQPPPAPPPIPVEAQKMQSPPTTDAPKVDAPTPFAGKQLPTETQQQAEQPPTMALQHRATPARPRRKIPTPAKPVAAASRLFGAVALFGAAAAAGVAAPIPAAAKEVAVQRDEGAAVTAMTVAGAARPENGMRGVVRGKGVTPGGGGVADVGGSGARRRSMVPRAGRGRR